MQALSYSEQLHFKEQKIRNNLIRIGGFDAEYIDERMQPIVGMEEPFHYRNKAQYPIGTDRDGNVITGFYAGRTHTIIANTDCALGASENQQILETILSYMRKNKVTAYDEVTGKGLVRHVLIRKGFTSGQLMVCLVINKKMTKCHTLLPEYRRIRMSFYQIRENYWLHWQNPRYDKCVSQYQCRENQCDHGYHDP